MTSTSENQHPLHGLSVVVTGTLVVGTRAEIEAYIAESGGVARSSVSSKTDLVVYGDKAGSKLAKAKQLGIDHITEKDFYDRYVFDDAKPSLEGLNVVLTGKLVIGIRADVEAFIADSGGFARSSVSGKTNLVVYGDKAGSKLAKARARGIDTMTEAEFYRRFGFE